MDDAQMVFAEGAGTYHCHAQVSHLQKTNIPANLSDYYPK
jgi:hypothetical protein